MWSSGATLLALLLVFVRPALGGACVLTVGSLYQLKSDTVDWTMQTSSGQSCIRGLRHARVTIDSAKLITPPQSGQVKLLGSGFSYTAKSDFEGQDSFTIQVSGMLNGVRGSSDIRIIVSVGPNVSPQTSPTERSDRPPADLSSAAFVRPALGDPCVLTVGSLYQLKSDTVDWIMQTSSGQSCIRGLRHKRVTIDSAKLISPPQSGQVKLLGSGFSYTAKSDFEGQDSFTIQVSGMLNGIRGSSDIRIIVSVVPNVSPQTSPTEFVRPALGDACVLTGGSLYQLKSDAVDWTMRTDSGQSCIRGLRHNRVTIDTAKLISPPQSGQVKLLGSGFSYTAKSDFEGQDSFTIQVSGMSNGMRGSSDIRIIVSVVPNVSPQTSPTEFVRPALGDACVLTGRFSISIEIG